MIVVTFIPPVQQTTGVSSQKKAIQPVEAPSASTATHPVEASSALIATQPVKAPSAKMVAQGPACQTYTNGRSDVYHPDPTGQTVADMKNRTTSYWYQCPCR